ERLITASAALLEDIEHERETLAAEQKKSESLQESIRDAENRTDELRSFLLTGAGQLSDLKNLQARCRENIDRIADRTGRLERDKQGRAEERAERTMELEKARNDFETKTTRYNEVFSEQEKLESAAERLMAKTEETSSELTSQVNEHSLMQHRFSSLEEIERQRSNYSEGVQKYLSARIPGEEISTAKTLADHIETDPAYEAALEDYLNAPLQYILVESREDALNGVERLRRIGAGKCTFMTIRNGRRHTNHDSRPQLNGDGIIGYLNDMLHMNDDVKHAFERALPEYASTIMVSDLNTAFRIAETVPGGNFLTLAGESYSPRGTLSAAGERKSMAGFLALKREKRELGKKLSTLQQKIELTRAELARLKNEHTVMTESIKALTAEARRLEVETAVTRQEIARLENELDKIVRAENVIDFELTQLAEERSIMEARLREAGARISEIEARSGTGSEELIELNNRLQSLRAEHAALSEKLGVLLSAQAVRQERKSAMEADVRRLRHEGGETSDRAAGNRAEAAQIAGRILNLENAQEDAGARIAECGRMIRETALQLDERQQELGARRAAMEQLEQRLRGLHEGREEAMRARGRIEIEKTRLENDMEHLERGCREEYHCSIPELIAGMEDHEWEQDYAEVSLRHGRLREMIENFGAINMRALEEYKELEQRYQFLNGQRLDIDKSIADTQKAIAEINRRSVEQFDEAFREIRRNFQEVFQILFEGGQCDLRLLDEDNILDSGIDIIAQPPGKRLQNILLLSGGEKALAALALLVAIFRYRPSPVCVLDEVDAPLDDANIARFSRLLTELSRNTQFIIITHNKMTMETAGALYGITMEEPGVSKVISVDFRDQQALAS
ncbi:MAG TPA: chromosome segregation protein SMC, partial [Acidobacteriota bacterium]|nr:chromosome segregation protein SMC [Acidobacteriota bacterium]